MTEGADIGVRAAVDIGTNSLRLLIVAPDGSDLVRWQRVTGLGRGVDASGALSEDSMSRTLSTLENAAADMRAHGVRSARAVATSAVRDAANRGIFLDRAAAILGFAPDVITGEEEARLSFAGATSGLAGEHLVVDIGGGSTEFVTAVGGISVDIGSVRLTERAGLEHPCDFDRLERASALAGSLLEQVPRPSPGSELIGVAGTWTSLAAIRAGSAEDVHGALLKREDLDRLVGLLASLTLEATADLPGLDPARAPVILGGALVARESVRQLGADRVIVSERDLLDGVVAAIEG